MPWWGFASEYILYARAAAAAKNLNYTFLEDDRNWNYGRLSNYFLPRRLSCVPPSDWSDPLLAVPLSPLSASSSPPHPRLKYSRLNLGDIDDWTREAYLSSAATQAALHALREDDLQHRVKGDRWILGEGESLPEAFGEVFSDQSEWVRENWRVAPAVREGIEAVRRAVGLDQPRWLAAEEEGEGRGPVVAVHVRLGDKASEYEHDAEEMGITNSFGNLTVYIEAAHDAYRRLIPSPYPPLSPSTQARFSPYAPPTLLLITAEPLIPARLREEVRLADPWRVVQSPGVDVEDEGEARERLRKEEEGKGGGRPKAYAAKGEGKGKEGKMIKLPLPPSTASPDPNRRRRRRSLDAGYTQQSFNALPLLSRVAHTQAFVRDLTLLAQEEGGVDAAVVSGASNVGRLAMLIAGKDAVLGPRDAQTGRPLGGRIRSVDAHFYPTAYSSAVYIKIEDVEDLENAAFVPEEQHRAEVEALEKQERIPGRESYRVTAMPTALTDTQPPPVILDLRNKPLHPSHSSPDSPPRSPSPSSTSSDSSVDPLIAQVIAGLRGTSEHVTPGQTSEDKEFAYKRSIPTMTLYSQRGLEIYEDITNTKAYYPFAAEKEILERFGDEIACRMFGLPSSVLLGDDGSSGGKEGEGEKVYERTGAGNKPADKEKWGDPSVGLHNYGVNGSSNLPSSLIPSLIPSQGLAVELGSGSLDKTRHLLRSMAKLLQPRKGGSEGEGVLKAIDYKALDLEAASLHSTLSSLASVEGESVTTSLDSSSPALDSTSGKRRVSVSGLHATYDEGLAFLKAQQHQSNGANGFSPSSRTSALSDSPLSSPESSPTRLPAVSETSLLEDLGRRATSILWLGSSCGNYTRSEAVEFLRNIELREGDTMVIGIDACQDGPKIVEAYNDPEGVTRAFILEGVDVAGRTLGAETAKVLNQDNFEYVNRWNVQLGRHEAYVRAKSDLSIPMPDGEDVELSAGELLNIEFSYKYTYSEALSLFHLSGFRLIQHWTDSSHSHYLYLVEKPRMWFPATQRSAGRMLGVEEEEEGENEYGVPRLEKWEEMWKAWDALMLDIIPPSLRFRKPIPLRHIPLFYVGHIPAFRDIHLSRYFSEPLTQPQHFADLFERGIDPCTDEPDKINHWHSEVPVEEEGWPAMEEIVQYEQRVRERVRSVYAKYEGRWERRLARVLMMVFEHEMMHWETAIYICLQACTSLNIPPGMAIPDFASLSRLTDREIAHELAVLGPNARKQRLSFEAQTIEVGHDDDDRVDEQLAFDPSHEFGWDVEHPKRQVEVGAFEIDALPVTNGEYLDWLVQNGGLEESKLVPASWAIGEGGKVAVKTLYGEVPIEYAREWPVAACAEQLERFAKDKGGRLPTFGELSVFLQQNPVSTPLSNVGFEHLHPVPPTLPGKGRDGSILPGTDGGLWQWTSSPLEAWDGYHDSVLYPGYSSDFMDGKHRIVLGGSYASPRRIVRPAMVNWYYGDYLFVLAGARIAYDV
ncbi:hypothetical protein NBRC10513v2_007531 [Rhodotorula toruloides]